MFYFYFSLFFFCFFFFFFYYVLFLFDFFFFFFFSSRRRHTRSKRDWSSDVCSSDLKSFHFGGECDCGGFGCAGDQRESECARICSGIARGGGGRLKHC